MHMYSYIYEYIDSYKANLNHHHNKRRRRYKCRNKIIECKEK